VSDLPWARQSVRVEQLGLHRTYFDEIWYLNFLSKSSFY
jgi:hypothetical protein